MNSRDLKVDRALREIGDVLLVCLRFEICPIERLNAALASIDEIMNDPGSLSQCEYYFKASRGSYILFFFSNIIYNLKTKNDLILDQEVLKWMASVWKNFIKRNKNYQELFPVMDSYMVTIKKYFSDEDSAYIDRLGNVNHISDQFLNSNDSDRYELEQMEKFCQMLEEVSNFMKPTFFFLQDFFREVKISTGEYPPEAKIIESNGLPGFGHENYSYKRIVEYACKSAGILEGVYLLLKKKKPARHFRVVDGRKKFMTTSEIYDYYAEKFSSLKNEYGELNSL